VAQEVAGSRPVTHPTNLALIDERGVPLGIDVHFHDYYIVVGHLPLAVGMIVLSLAAFLGAWKLTKYLWLMLAG
jgi:hypothetical protein